MSSRKKKKTNRTISGRRAHSKPKRPASRIIRWSGWRLGGLLSVVLVSLVLNSVGLEWGRSGLVPWQADSIEGITTVREMPRLFGQWKYKYPRGQFLVNAIFYRPLLQHWQKNPVMVTTADGRDVPRSMNLQRLDLLAKISRMISVVMGTGAVVAVFFTAMYLFRDYPAALLAALALALSQLFVFYSHVGNVDMPCVFWFVWGIYWAVKAIYVGKMRHYVLMGLFFSLSICTKDAILGYLAGMVPAFWLAMTGKARGDGRSLKTAVLSVFSRKVAAAVVTFLFVYALLQGIFTSPGAFSERMSVWIGGRGVVDYNKGFTGQLPLLWQACQMLYGSLGWALLAAIVLSLVSCGIRHPWKSAFLIVPFLAFYVIVVMNIKMVHPRYFLPAYAGFAILVGKGCADLLRYRKVHPAWRIPAVLLVYVLSFVYCVGLDLEMLNDSRRQTERWFSDNVDRKAVVAVVIRNICYAPRLYAQGFHFFVCPWKVPADNSDFSRLPSYPEYIIITEPRLTPNETPTRDFRQALLSGQVNYDEAARFWSRHFYPPKHTALSIAGWPLDRRQWLYWMSPEIIVFKKK